MNGHLRRVDVLLALVTVGLVSVWGDPPNRFFNVSCLLVFWSLYFSGAVGLRFLARKKAQPALSKS